MKFIMNYLYRTLNLFPAKTDRKPTYFRHFRASIRGAYEKHLIILQFIWTHF